MKHIFPVVILFLGITSCAKQIYFTSGIDGFHGVKWHSTSGSYLVTEDLEEFRVAPSVNILSDSTRSYGIVVKVVSQDWLFLSPKSVLEVVTDNETFQLFGFGSRDARSFVSEEFFSRSGRSKDGIHESAQFVASDAQISAIANSSSVSFALLTERTRVEGRLKKQGKTMFMAFMFRHITVDEGPKSD